PLAVRPQVTARTGHAERMAETGVVGRTQTAACAFGLGGRNSSSPLTCKMFVSADNDSRGHSHSHYRPQTRRLSMALVKCPQCHLSVPYPPTTCPVCGSSLLTTATQPACHRNGSAPPTQRALWVYLSFVVYLVLVATVTLGPLVLIVLDQSNLT